MARKYHSLLLNVAEAGEPARWSIEFGDYDRHCVVDEFDEYKRDHPAGRLRIITTADGQAAINAAVAKLNDWRAA